MTTGSADQGRSLRILFWEADPATLRIEFLGGDEPAPLGCSREAWMAADGGWLDLVHPADREEVEALCRGVVADGAPRAGMHRMGPGGDDARWVRSGYWLRDAPGAGVRVVGVLVDATEALEQASQAAQERTHSLHRTVLEATADGILAIDGKRRVTAANRRFAELWGIPPEMLERGNEREALRLALEQLTDPDAFLESIEQMEADPELEVSDVLRLRDGRIIERTSLPQRLDGAIVGRVFTFRDVTARLEAEAERDRLLRRAQESVRLRDEFLSIASHELRTPLTSILLALQNLQRLAARAGSLEEAPRDRVTRTIDTGVHQVKRLGALVDDLLDVARIESERLVLHRQRVDLGLLAQEVVGHLQQTMEAAGCPVTLEARSPAEGYWDRLRVEQVIGNLLSNAARYAAGAPVFVRIWSDGHLVHLVVQDRGKGIPPDLQRRIFDRFQRGGVEEHQGLGLGLYIVDRLVRAHGGEVSVRSEPGQGSTFKVRLPVSPPQAGRAQAPASEPGAPADPDDEPTDPGHRQG